MSVLRIGESVSRLRSDALIYLLKLPPKKSESCPRGSAANKRENFPRSLHYLTITELERSHAELRRALVLAGREIRRLNIGRTANPVLNTLRAVLRTSPLKSFRFLAGNLL
jgi:hypothetical protein